MSKLGPCAPGFCVAMEALDWQPVCCSQQAKAQDKVSQIAKQLRGVCVVTAGQWAPQQKMFAVIKVPVSPDMKSFTFCVSTT